jgi:catechol 1,2-dioxygenase
MLVDAMAHPNPGGATESTVLGPFWTPDAPRRAFGERIAEQSGGTPALVRGHVRNTRGEPIAGAELDIWQNGDNGLYAVQDDDAPEAHLRGRFTSRQDGSYAFVGVRPIPYTIPHDGPVGAMLTATRRHPWRPAHIHMIVSAPGYQRLQTHIFDSASAYLDSDAVFAVKPSLVREFRSRAPDHPDTPAGVIGPWCLVENDIVLQPV